MPENMISIRCWHIHIIHSGRLLHFQNCVYGFEARVGIWNGNFILQNKTFPIFITKSSNTIYPKICIFSFRVLKAVKHRHIGILYRSAHENLLNWFTSRLLYFMVDRALGCYCCCSSRQALAIFLHTHGLNYLKITFLSPSTHKFISLLTMLPCFISALLIQHSYTHTWTKSRWNPPQFYCDENCYSRIKKNCEWRRTRKLLQNVPWITHPSVNV